ncbi:hypothetical protein P5G50_15680 [Leifsonia sp. F6_8S_P_1B]|uniref:Uncharacterized protein n=1 Tax=Leifsonia williamsii TaxID=3035919 RepID=A0ABT8KEL4_9MICO|nr:hypothetical protein [Leifsonia williamsii]MDN4615891.1 hypothetical protein [Leifsonia williamsii]
MPSFRVIATVGLLRPGVPPTAVQPAAADAAAELTVVEASSIDVVRGEARLTVRFMADDVPGALHVAEHTVAALRALADVDAWRLTERVGGRWFRRA